jgi:glycosyltransferase involved in cell wall biosynthesis
MPAPIALAEPRTVLFPFTGNVVGGSHISTFHLARALTTEFGIRTIVLAPAQSAIVGEAGSRGLEVEALPDAPKTARQYFRDLASLPRRLRLLRRHGAGTVLHCSDLWTMQAWAPGGRLLRLPIVYHHRAFEGAGIVSRTIVGMAGARIAISQSCEKNLSAITSKPIKVILNPFVGETALDVARWRSELVQAWPGQEPVAVVGFSANLQRRKRPRFFIEVAARVADREPTARFVMFGRERDYKFDELMAYARELGVGDKLLLAGFRSPPERNLAVLDVLATPALAEPFGRTLVEALLLGVPYVGTDDAGHSEIAARWGGGLLLPVDATAERFADEILNVLGSRGATALSVARRKEVAIELSPRAHAGHVLDVYRRLLSRG